MAFRTWGRLLLTALGVSLLAGAGQLGIAFGFGIVRLTGTFTGATINQWPAQLVWAGWFAANAAVVGAVLTERLARRDGGLAGTGQLLAVAGGAALGATVVAPLCMQPARAAELVSVDPVWAVGICAVLGALAGAGAAIAVLLRPPVGWNMAAVACVVWLLALVSVAPSLFSTGPLDTVRLGVLEPASLDADAAQRLALVVLPLVALLAGAATGAVSRWHGHPPLVSGATGVAGPVLVAFAYLTAGPGDNVDRYQLMPYYAALLAVATGALGAAAAALLRWPLGTHTAPTGAIEPTDILRPLPAGPDLPQASASARGDEPETVDLAGADLAGDQAGGGLVAANGPRADLIAADGPRADVVAGRAGGTGSGSGTATGGDVPAPRAVPPHWDWPADGGTAPAPAGARTGADARRTSATPVDNPPATDNATAADRPLTPQPARARDDAERAPSAPSAPGSTASPAPASRSSSLPTPTAAAAPPATEAPGAEDRPAEGPTSAAPPAEGPTSAAQPAEGPMPAEGPTPAAQPAKGPAFVAQPAEGPTSAGRPVQAGAEQQAAPSAPKPRRTRKPRSPRQPAAATPGGTDPTPVAAEGPVTAAPPPVATPPPDAVTPPVAAPPPVAAAPPTSPDAAAPSAATAPQPAPVDASSSTTSPHTSPAGAASAPESTSVDSPATTAAAAGTTAANSTAAPGPVTVPPAAPAQPSPSRPRPGTTTTAAQPTTEHASEPTPRPETEATTGRTEPTTAHSPESTPRPRHRAPIPDLARAASWEALATARRGGPASTSADAVPENAAEAKTPAGSTSSAAPEQPTGRGRGRLGLFRRNRARIEDAPADRESEPLPAQDEEYVDWVTGLSKPVPDNEPEQETGRRSLRSTGRHHRD
ncbi:hypothetical protein ACGFIR_18585 [Micromonospora sp. NPDC049051]|uniref:hypothetical protein n=1 Tax=Micromonospora sp. NPDC049051 TaxID=3364264 RepID=UPI0037185596